MSTGIQISSGSSGISVGTTAVTSGTNGRVFFQAGGVVQQDANFTFDNTLKRLTLKAVGTAATDIPFAVQNSAGTRDFMRVRGDGATIIQAQTLSDYTFTQDGNQAVSFIGKTSGSTLFELGNDFNAAPSQLYTGALKLYNWSSVLKTRIQAVGTSYWADSTAVVSIGSSTNGARLDVRAQGALSTDIAFRVRNSVDTADLFKIRGNASTIFGGTGADYLSIIGGSNWGTDCYFDFSGGNYIRFLGQNGDISIFTNSSLRSRGTYIGGATQLVYFDNGGNIRIGQGHSNVNQPDVNATRTIQQMTGVAPTTSVADGFQQYSADITAGNAAPHFRTENGSIIKLYRETTAVGAATLVSGSGTTLTDTDTFDGYTLEQVVKALRNLGILA